MADSNPYSLYDYNIAGIPESYTQQLLGLGYVPRPMATEQETFSMQENFQRLLKQMLDTQMKAFEPYTGVNTGALPFNMRNMFSQASNVFNDPFNSIQGTPGFFGGGYKYGELPNNLTWWHAARNQALAAPQTNATPVSYPNVPAPMAQQSSGGGGSAPPNQNKQFTVGLQGGGSMTVNAHDAQSAVENARQGGNTPDPSKVKQGAYQSF